MKQRYKAKVNLYVSYEMYLVNHQKDCWGEDEKMPLFRKGDIVEVDFDKFVSKKWSESYTEQYVRDDDGGFINLSKGDNRKRYEYSAILHMEELKAYFKKEIKK